MVRPVPIAAILFPEIREGVKWEGGSETPAAPVRKSGERNRLPSPGFGYNRTIVLLSRDFSKSEKVSQKVGKSSLTGQGKRG